MVHNTFILISRELSNAYPPAKFGFDAAENEPSKLCADGKANCCCAGACSPERSFSSMTADSSASDPRFFSTWAEYKESKQCTTWNISVSLKCQRFPKHTNSENIKSCRNIEVNCLNIRARFVISWNWIDSETFIPEYVWKTAKVMRNPKLLLRNLLYLVCNIVWQGIHIECVPLFFTRMFIVTSTYAALKRRHTIFKVTVLI